MQKLKLKQRLLISDDDPDDENDDEEYDDEYDEEDDEEDALYSRNDPYTEEE